MGAHELDAAIADTIISLDPYFYGSRFAIHGYVLLDCPEASRRVGHCRLPRNERDPVDLCQQGFRCDFLVVVLRRVSKEF